MQTNAAQPNSIPALTFNNGSFPSLAHADITLRVIHHLPSLDHAGPGGIRHCTFVD